VLARLATLDQIGVGEQTMAKRHFFDDVGIVAGAAEPLIDDVDQTDVIGTIETGVNEIRPIDVEDHVTSGPWLSMSLFHDPNCDKGVLHNP